MKILILADALDVGGVESHIETLALGLKLRGHEVLVASFGGATGKRLSQEGIKCFNLLSFSPAPQRQKAKSRSKIDFVAHKLILREQICKILDAELPDLVHAHTRMTAFLVSNACKRRKIPLVTTAHAKFDMNFPKNLLSQWGDALICVSEDIKKHIFEQPMVATMSTKVIFNGVSLSNSNPQFDFSTHKIAFISRLDADSSLGASLLCEIAPTLALKYPDLTIKIIGGGSEFAKILKKSDGINQKLNRELIKTLGKVENPINILDGDELLIAVSRAALEGMALGLPTILLGNEGYLGLLNEGVLPLAMHTNFTCRGFCVNKSAKDDHKHATNGCLNEALKQELLREITRFFEMPTKAKRQISNFAQRLVADYYSADKMVDLTLEVYRGCIKRCQKMTILGYYGHGNLGDEVVLNSILKSINHERFSVEIVKGKNPFRLMQTLAKTDFFVFGGGSLLQNCTSDLSLLYYLFALKVASKLCRRTIMLSNGIGPIKNSLFSRKKWLKIIGKTLDRLDYISVRDSNSRLLIQKITPNRKIEIVPDPALINFGENAYKNTVQSSASNEKIVFIPCRNELERSFLSIEVLARELSTLANSFSVPILIINLNPHEDTDACKELSYLLGAKMLVPKNASELKNHLSSAKLCISQRYHGLLFSVGCDVPVLAISNDPKIVSFCDENDVFPAITPSKMIKADALLHFSKRALCHYKQHRENIKTLFFEKSKMVKEKLPRLLG